MSSLSFHPPAFVFFRVCALREWFSLNQELIVVAISNVCSPLFSFLREYVFCRVCMCMRVCTSSCVTFPRVSFVCLSLCVLVFHVFVWLAARAGLLGEQEQEASSVQDFWQGFVWANQLHIGRLSLPARGKDRFS